MAAVVAAALVAGFTGDLSVLGRVDFGEDDNGAGRGLTGASASREVGDLVEVGTRDD